MTQLASPTGRNSKLSSNRFMTLAKTIKESPSNSEGLPAKELAFLKN